MLSVEGFKKQIEKSHEKHSSNSDSDIARKISESVIPSEFSRVNKTIFFSEANVYNSSLKFNILL